MASQKSQKRRRKERARALASASPPGAPPTAEGEATDPQPQRSKPVKRTERRAEKDAPPPAPWGRFPLVELSVLAGIGLLIAGFFVQGDTGMAMLLTGLALASIAGLEVAVREHLAGYRSHTLVLAGLPTVVVTILVTLLADSLPLAARLGIGAAVFGLAAFVLTRIFQARSGGHAFRIAKPRRGM